MTADPFMAPDHVIGELGLHFDHIDEGRVGGSVAVAAIVLGPRQF